MGDKKSRRNPADRVNLLNLSPYAVLQRERRRAEPVMSRTREQIFTMIRILLAEDDDVMREYLARALTGAGYHVTAVDRGTAAVPYIDSGIFDLLLSDIVMPEMDGIELAQHTAKAAPQTQVMFITGFAAVSLRAEENVPQAKLLSKPFHLKDLVREVDNLFGRADRSNQQ